MAQAYSTFRPSAGFSAEHAVQAEHVGIVSGNRAFPPRWNTGSEPAVVTLTASLVNTKPAQNRHQTIW